MSFSMAVYGERNGNAKLTWEKVRKIRRSKGIISYRKLAKLYSIHVSHVQRIMNEEVWFSNVFI